MNPKENINFIFQLSNKNRSSYFFLLFIVSGVLALGVAFYFVATNRNIALIVTIVVAVAFFILLSKIKPAFFEILVTDEQLQVNYYAVSSVVRSYQSIEMNLFQLKDFNVQKRFWGLRKSLILSVDSKYGLADYPPVSISILSKKEIAQVFHVLHEIVKNNQKT